MYVGRGSFSVDRQAHHVICMTDCGHSLNIPRSRRRSPVPPLDHIMLDAQIACILDNLQHCGIEHLDMVDVGKNLCLSDDGVLAVIDFDIACGDGKPLTRDIELRLAHRKDIHVTMESVKTIVEKWYAAT